MPAGNEICGGRRGAAGGAAAANDSSNEGMTRAKRLRCGEVTVMGETYGSWRRGEEADRQNFSQLLSLLDTQFRIDRFGRGEQR